MTNERYGLIKNIRLMDPVSQRTEATDLLYLQKEGKSTVLQMGKGLKAPQRDGLTVTNMHGAPACPAFTDLRCAHPEYENMVKNAAKAADCRLFPTVPVTLGGRGETLSPFEALREKGALAISADLEKKELSGKLYLAALEESKHLQMLFIAPCHEKSLSGSGVNKGRISARLKEEG